MKRFAFASLVLCLIVLASGFLVETKAGAHPAAPRSVQRSSTSSPIGLAQLKVQVRQALGQKAVDAMKYRSTESHASAPPPELLKQISRLRKQARTITAPRVQADAQELYVNDPQLAGYSINAEGTSWVQGIAASFNATRSEGIPLNSDDTDVLLTTASSQWIGDQWIYVGVNSNNDGTLNAYTWWLNWSDWNHPHGGYQKLFSVRAGDQINVAIEKYTSDDPWSIFIEDVPLAKYQWVTETDTTNFTRAYWVLNTSGAPIAPRFPSLIGFRYAQWLSNWDGWQPITSSAARTYSEITNVSSGGGVVWPGGLADGGTSFALIPCSTCVYPS